MNEPPVRSHIALLRWCLPAAFMFTIALAVQAQPADTPHTAYTSASVETRTLADYLHENLLPNVPKVGLVLTGGGARGFAQIGVLKALERAHIPVHFIVGTSMGALVGGLYASGYSADDLDSIARTTNWDAILALGDENYRRELYFDQKLESDRTIISLQLEGPSFPLQPSIPDAISEGKRLSAYINSLVWNALYHSPDSFDNLKYPFRAAATDIVTGNLIVYNRGNLAEILRASASEPLRFAPVTHDSLVLMDGGLVDNIPVEIAKQAGCDVIIVVNSTSPLNARADLTTPWNVADQVVTLMMRRQYDGALAKANIVITPDIGAHKASDFTGIDSLIAAGYTSAQPCIPEIRDTMNSRPHPPAITDLPVHPGKITSVRIEGMKFIDSQVVHATLLNLIGKQHDARDCLPVFEEVLRRFRHQGYTFATIEKTAFYPSTGELAVIINEGILASVHIQGNTYTNDAVILREFALRMNEPFSTRDADQTLTNLNSTELFRQMSFEALPTTDGIEANIQVVEQPSPWVARLSGKIDNERNTQLGVELADDNLDGRGVEASGMIFGGLRNRTIELTLSSRRFLSSYLSYDFTAYSRQRNIYVYADSQVSANFVNVNTTGEYSQVQNGGEFSLGENVPRFGDISVFARYEWQFLSSLSGAGLNGIDKVASLGGQLRLDTQDKFPFPQDGTLASALYESAFKTLGANTAFTKFQISYETYVSYNDVSTLHPKIRFEQEDQTTPTADQFRLGGQYSFLGMREDEYLGNQAVAAGLEYRYRLPFKLYFDSYLKGEYDIGAVWPKISTIHFGDLRHGAGVSLALDTPVGIVDVAVAKSFIIANPIQAHPFAEFFPTFFYFTIGRGL